MRWWRPSVTLLGTVLLFGTPFEGQVYTPRTHVSGQTLVKHERAR